MADVKNTDGLDPIKTIQKKKKNIGNAMTTYTEHNNNNIIT